MARLSNGHADDDTKHDTESDTTDSSSDDEDDDDDDDDDDESSTDTDEDTPGQLPGISVKQAARAAVLAAGATGLAGLDRPDGNPTPRHRRIDSLRAASKMGDMNVDGEPSQESSGGESDDDAPAQLQAAARRAESRRAARGRSSSPRRAVRGNKASAVRAASKVKPWGSTSPASARSRRQRKLINTGKALGKFQTGKKNHPKELTPRVRETPPPVKVRKSKRRRGPAKTIWEAAKNGDTSAVRTFVVEQDVYVNSKDKLGNTPLIWAAYGGHRHTLQELVALGADVNMKTRVREAMLRVMSPHSTPVFLFGAFAEWVYGADVGLSPRLRRHRRGVDILVCESELEGQGGHNRADACSQEWLQAHCQHAHQQRGSRSRKEQGTLATASGTLTNELTACSVPARQFGPCLGI